MNLKPFTSTDAAALVESRRNLRVGERVEPLVFTGDGLGHRVEMVVKQRIEGEHGSVRFICVDDSGKEHEVWSMDDPRRV